MNPELEKAMEAIYLKGWQDTYRHTEDDRAAAAWAESVAERSSGPGDSAHGNAMYANRLLFGAKWLHCGRVKLVTSHTYAAALMSSTVTESLTEDMILPWKAFRVELPVGVLATEELRFEAIDVGCYDGLAFGCMMNLQGSRFPKTETQGNVQFIRAASDPATMFFSKEAADVIHDGSGMRDFDVKERAMRLAIRLVTGLLYTVQHTDNFQKRTYGDRERRTQRSGPPPHRMYYVGKPLKYDCRPAVSHYLGGHCSAPPAVQSMVRGHYKRQVVGIGRTGRKVIWVEPYWRGPEDAPILARPYQIDGTK